MHLEPNSYIAFADFVFEIVVDLFWLVDHLQGVALVDGGGVVVELFRIKVDLVVGDGLAAVVVGGQHVDVQRLVFLVEKVKVGTVVPGLGLKLGLD